MGKLSVIVLLFFLVTGMTYAQSESNEKDKKDQLEKKAPPKKEAKISKKALSFGEMAEDAGKRIWGNVKGFFNVVAEDMIDKKDRIMGDKKGDEKEKKKDDPGQSTTKPIEKKKEES